jgi:hypothetical protein
MTAPLFQRRRVATRPARPVIVSVTNTWKVTDAGNLRRVIVREPDGQLGERYVPDAHPALVRTLDVLTERAAVAA